MSAAKERLPLFSLGETREERQSSKWLFLIGLFSQTQINIGGYIGVSEFFLVLLMPLQLLRYQGFFRREGVAPVIRLLLIWLLGAIVSDLYNHNYWQLMVRGWAVPICVLACVATVYPLLKRNPVHGLKWAVIGLALTQVLSIFVLQPGCIVGTDLVESGEMSAAEATMGYKLFWVSMAQSFLVFPIKAWYLQTPHVVSCWLAFALPVISLLSGGRSAFAWQTFAAILVTVGGKSSRKLVWLKRNFVPMLLVMGVALFAVKGIYKKAAQSGIMGEKELEKYEQQAASGSLLKTLMAGRTEVFVSLFAIADKPLLGHGSVALDFKGYRRDFCLKYGNDEDIEKMQKSLALWQGHGMVLKIPAHSHITCYWMWHGVAGLLFWLYVLKLFFGTITRRLHVIPSYYGFLVYGLCAASWDIFFSPLGARVPFSVLVCACLVVKTIEKQRPRGL